MPPKASSGLEPVIAWHRTGMPGAERHRRHPRRRPAGLPDRGPPRRRRAPAWWRWPATTSAVADLKRSLHGVDTVVHLASATADPVDADPPGPRRRRRRRPSTASSWSAAPSSTAPGPPTRCRSPRTRRCGPTPTSRRRWPSARSSGWWPSGATPTPSATVAVLRPAVPVAEDAAGLAGADARRRARRPGRRRRPARRSSCTSTTSPAPSPSSSRPASTARPTSRPTAGSPASRSGRWPAGPRVRLPGRLRRAGHVVAVAGRHLADAARPAAVDGAPVGGGLRPAEGPGLGGRRTPTRRRSSPVTGRCRGRRCRRAARQELTLGASAVAAVAGAAALVAGDPPAPPALVSRVERSRERRGATLDRARPSRVASHRHVDVVAGFVGRAAR